MKSFNEAYRQAKADRSLALKQIYEEQKVQLCNALKIEYMVEGKISDLPYNKQQEILAELLEYWSPKTGINNAGIKFLNEGVINISPSSTGCEIKRYITNETKKNASQIVEAFKCGHGNDVIESFKEDLEAKCGKHLNEHVIRDIVWGTIEDKIKFGGC